MQVQSASDPPKKLALGERAVQADGNEYNIFQIKESGGPVEPVYATEGTPLVVGPNAIFKTRRTRTPRGCSSALLQPECQQLISDVGGQRSIHRRSRRRPAASPSRRSRP